jgi:hypothetical protein
MPFALSSVRDFFAQSFWIPQPPLTEANLPDQAGKVSVEAIELLRNPQSPF